MGDHERERHRRAIDIGAAHVEQPRHAIERGDHGCVGAIVAQPLRQHRALFGDALPGMGIGMGHRQRRRRRRPVLPHGIDGIAVHGHQARALGFQCLGHAIGPGLGMQPGIIADTGAARRMLTQPGRRAGLRHRLVFIEPAVHLLAHLDGIAPIDEDRRAILEHHCRAGRSAKTGEPAQPLGIAADIFAHVLVGNRDDKAVQPASPQLGAQCFQAGFVGLHQHGMASLGVMGR